MGQARVESQARFEVMSTWPSGSHVFVACQRDGVRTCDCGG